MAQRVTTKRARRAAIQREATMECVRRLRALHRSAADIDVREEIANAVQSLAASMSAPPTAKEPTDF